MVSLYFVFLHLPGKHCVFCVFALQLSSKPPSRWRLRWRWRLNCCRGQCCWRCPGRCRDQWDRPRHGRGRRRAVSAADGRSGAPEREARSGFGFAHGFAHILRVTCLTRAPPRARSAGRLYCTVFLVCFCSQGENTVFFVFLNPIFVVLPPRHTKHCHAAVTQRSRRSVD